MNLVPLTFYRDYHYHQATNGNILHFSAPKGINWINISCNCIKNTKFCTVCSVNNSKTLVM